MPVKLPWLKGVFPALVTPFVKKTEEVDEEAYRLLIRSCLPHVDGLVTSGTTPPGRDRAGGGRTQARHRRLRRFVHPGGARARP